MEETSENPIDPDKVADRPGLLEYAHHVGSAVIKPEDRGKLKSRALSAMYEQTDLQLQQIKEQIDLLAKQAREIELRKGISEKIYGSGMSFEPIVGHTYHLYEKDDGTFQLSMLSNDDWGRSRPLWEYIAAVKLLGDHTWQMLDHE